MVLTSRSHLRKLYLMSALVLTGWACTLSPLNPQPLPPADDDEPRNPASTFADSGFSAPSDAAKQGDDKTPYPPAPPNDAATTGAATDGGANDAMSPHDAGAGDAADAGDADTGPI